MSLSFEQVAQALWWSLGATELLVALFVTLAFLLTALHRAVQRDDAQSEAEDWPGSLSGRS